MGIALTGALLVAVAMVPGTDTGASLHEAAKTVKVVVPPKHRAATLLPAVDQEDIKPAHGALADKVLRALPSHCRNNLENFYVIYDPKNTSRGLGGENTIIVTGNVSDKEFMALVTHECGHVTDLGGLRGNAFGGRTAFHDGPTAIYGDDPSVRFYEISWVTPETMQRNSKDSDFVSGYAKSDPFEDFAESFAYYALQEKEFARLATMNPIMKAKYEFMRDIVFAETGPIADGKHVRGKKLPWDVTKLESVWHAKK